MKGMLRSTASRRYLAAAVVAMTSAALAIGPGQGAAQARASGPAGDQAAVQHPVFEHGLAMPVFTESPADYVEQELWVTSSTDSDHDGRKDLIHIDVTRVSETEHGLKVPVIFEASPYY